ncbi:ribonuclease M5 [Pseudogracilibacillus sp. SE30717A]|uniref:ribonuclease M5 n=1 Tax=Pseudogracilibacillus sp. SE30717A TaxID=3098293 RepID=UPI00300E3351
MQIKEIIVVEGKSDTQKIKKAVQADTIETNGSAINKETLTLIKHAQEKRGVIIFTDPDYPGERIRHIITREVKGCKHAFLPKERARAKSELKSLGIEHASIESIREALSNVYDSAPIHKSDITKSDLIGYGLIGTSDAKSKREQLGKYLHIGHTNGKQLLNRLHMFQITKNELDLAMMHILERGQQDA